MEFKDTVIQLSNISLFSTTDISAAPFPALSNDKAFLSKVVDVLTYIVRNPETAGEISINVKDCTFSGNSHVVTNAIGK